MMDSKMKCRIAERDVWVISCFCVGLRGEEVLLIKFAGTAKSPKDLSDALPHFVLIVLDQTKGNQLLGSKFGLPCFSFMEGRYRRPDIWLD
jgi:hypothetical protein